MFESVAKMRLVKVFYGPGQPARVVVALRERKTGRIYRGEAHEMHADLRVREELGRCTEGWLDAGFIDLATDEFLTRGGAARRFPFEAGRTRGRGCADSSDFECIQRARRARKASRDGTT